MNENETNDLDYVLMEDIPLTDDTEWNEFAAEEISNHELTNDQDDWIVSCY